MYGSVWSTALSAPRVRRRRRGRNRRHRSAHSSGTSHNGSVRGILRRSFFDLLEAAIEQLHGAFRRAERRVGLTQCRVHVGSKMRRRSVLVFRRCFELFDSLEMVSALCGGEAEGGASACRRGCISGRRRLFEIARSLGSTVLVSSARRSSSSTSARRSSRSSTSRMSLPVSRYSTETSSFCASFRSAFTDGVRAPASIREI